MMISLLQNYKILYGITLVHFWPSRAFWMHDYKSIVQLFHLKQRSKCGFCFHYFTIATTSCVYHPNILILLMWIAPYIENTTTFSFIQKNLRRATRNNKRKQSYPRIDNNTKSDQNEGRYLLSTKMKLHFTATSLFK